MTVISYGMLDDRFRREDAEIEARQGKFLKGRADNDHGVIERHRAIHSVIVGREEEESESKRGRSTTPNVAIAHARFAIP